MPDATFRKFIRPVVNVYRGVRQYGGKMRPYEKPIWICHLSCGHVVERLKSQTVTVGPPKRAKCVECMEQVDDKA